MAGLVGELVAMTAAIGKQKVELRLATKRDIGRILQLYYEEGWIDYTHQELEYLFDACPNGCFKLMLQDQLIGVNFATLVGNGICYPHSNLISSAYRSKVNYFDEATKYNEYLKTLARLDVLYAARKVIRLYQSGGGFEPIGYYRRAAVDVLSMSELPSGAHEATPGDLPDINAYCRGIYHSDREALIRYFVERGIARAYLLRDAGGAVTAFAMVRKLPKYHLVGPVLARDDDAAAQVVIAAARGQPDPTVLIEGGEDKLRRLLEGHFTHRWEDNVMLKMYRGDKTLLEDESAIYGVFARYTS